MAPEIFDPTLPFALLWDGARARLFSRPRATIVAHATVDVLAAFDTMRTALQDGDWLAGGLSYEAGMAFHPRLCAGATRRTAAPVLWFGRFGPPVAMHRAEVGSLLDRFGAYVRIGALRPHIAASTHQGAVASIQELIAAGDVYQVNLTFGCDLEFAGHPIALFARLFSMAHAPHAALVHRGDGHWWLSLSPELFFTAGDGRLTARPMKGTAPRGPDSATDGIIAAELLHDAKNRAENLMITDLLRNDLSRIAQPGSVRVPRLLDIETYPTVHQMTSTITADLAPDRDLIDALPHLFPCGSVTGAPKIRAMEIIHDLESGPRGIYCGGIGWLAPGGREGGFNVAIRTLEIAGNNARLGLGSGIVADSDAAAEWRECLIKGQFLRPAGPRTLIETMRREPDGHIQWQALHLERLRRSSERFGIPFAPDSARRLLAELRPPTGAQRVRLLLAAGGAMAVQLSPAPQPQTAVRVKFARREILANDWRLAHKSTDRAFHESARRASGADEIIWFDSDGFATEGSFTNLFVRDDGKLLTPPLTRGLLPGILRAALLAEGKAVEADIPLAMAQAAGGSGRLFLGNALRGLMMATLAEDGPSS